MRLEQATFQDLVGVIYDAALDPALWPNALARVSDALSAIGGRYISYHAQCPERSHYALGRLDPDLMQPYLTRHSRNCPWSKLPHVIPVGTAASSDAFVAASELTRTEFYDDILRPQRILHGAAAVLARDAERSVGFSVFRGPESGPFEEPDLQTLAALIPHVRRASQIAWRLGTLAMLDEAKSAALDCLDHGVVLVDRRGRALFTSRAAALILALGDGLTLTAEGLGAAASKDAERLRKLVADAARGGSGGMMRVARPSLAEPFLVLVAPARRHGSWPIEAGPAAVVFITDPERAPRPEHRLLAELFGLTATEAKVALSIAAGNAVPASARQLRISANTVHTHLRCIFRKLGIHRQADLVRVLMRAGLVAPAGDRVDVNRIER